MVQGYCEQQIPLFFLCFLEIKNKLYLCIFSYLKENFDIKIKNTKILGLKFHIQFHF
jgi:hypothetical protein